MSIQIEASQAPWRILDQVKRRIEANRRQYKDRQPDPTIDGKEQASFWEGRKSTDRSFKEIAAGGEDDLGWAISFEEFWYGYWMFGVENDCDPEDGPRLGNGHGGRPRHGSWQDVVIPFKHQIIGGGSITCGYPVVDVHGLANPKWPFDYEWYNFCGANGVTPFSSTKVDGGSGVVSKSGSHFDTVGSPGWIEAHPGYFDRFVCWGPVTSEGQFHRVTANWYSLAMDTTKSYLTMVGRELTGAYTGPPDTNAAMLSGEHIDGMYEAGQIWKQPATAACTNHITKAGTGGPGQAAAVDYIATYEHGPDGKFNDNVHQLKVGGKCIVSGTFGQTFNTGGKPAVGTILSASGGTFQYLITKEGDDGHPKYRTFDGWKYSVSWPGEATHGYYGSDDNGNDISMRQGFYGGAYLYQVVDDVTGGNQYWEGGFGLLGGLHNSWVAKTADGQELGTAYEAASPPSTGYVEPNGVTRICAVGSRFYFMTGTVGYEWDYGSTIPSPDGMAGEANPDAPHAVRGANLHVGAVGTGGYDGEAPSGPWEEVARFNHSGGNASAEGQDRRNVNWRIMFWCFNAETNTVEEQSGIIQFVMDKNSEWSSYNSELISRLGEAMPSWMPGLAKALWSSGEDCWAMWRTNANQTKAYVPGSWGGVPKYFEVHTIEKSLSEVGARAFHDHLFGTRRTADGKIERDPDLSREMVDLAELNDGWKEKHHDGQIDWWRTGSQPQPAQWGYWYWDTVWIPPN